jgi:protein gp37
VAENSNIEWTTHTFNPWRGCTKVSAGCKHCYADTLAGRNPAVLGVWGPKGTRVVAAEKQWREPLGWDKKAKAAGERHRVFCASLADVFEDWTGPMVDSTGMKLHADRRGMPIGDDGLTPGDRDMTMQDVRLRLFDLIDRTPNLDWQLLTKRPQNWRREWTE